MNPHPMFAPLVPLYAAAVSVRNWSYDLGVASVHRAGVPVISVGNVTAGGTGKTPMTIEIVSLLKRNNIVPAVVSRGYGRMTFGTVVVSDGRSLLADPEHGGDEPVLIASRTGNAVVIADEDRVRGAQHAVEQFGVQCIVLDDGFQHRRLHRDLDIVLCDAQQPPYATSLLPAGYRREPVRSLRRAGAVVVTKAADERSARVLAEDERMDWSGPLFTSSFVSAGIRHLFGGVKQSTEILKGLGVVLVSGIAHPEGFRKQAEAAGAVVKRAFNFPDHHRYTEREVRTVVEAFHATGADYLLTTEKDAVRLQAFEPLLVRLPVSAFVMEVVMHQKEAWESFVLKAVRT